MRVQAKQYIRYCKHWANILHYAAADYGEVVFKLRDGKAAKVQVLSFASRASIYAATSRYEPFGMAALEAALSRCALVANDIPSFREVWGEAALYFRANDASSLASLVRRLSYGLTTK